MFLYFNIDGLDKFKISLIFQKMMYFVGDFLIIQCIIDSNLLFVFIWNFYLKNKIEEMLIIEYVNKIIKIIKIVFDRI